jgi:hypothetical protein
MRVIAVPSAETAGHSFEHADLVLPNLVGALPEVTRLLDGDVSPVPPQRS